MSSAALNHVLIDTGVDAADPIAAAISSTGLATPIIGDVDRFSGLVNDQSLRGVIVSGDDAVSGGMPTIGMAAASEVPVYVVTPSDQSQPVALALARAGVDDFLILPTDGAKAGVVAALAARRGELDQMSLAGDHDGVVGTVQDQMSADDEQDLGAGFHLEVHQSAGKDITGDCWGVKALDDGRIVMWVADFPGVGAEPGIHTLRLRSLMAGLPIMPDRPEEVLAWLNHRFVRLLPDGQGVAMIYAVVDNQFDSCVYAASGIPGPLILSVTGNLVAMGEGKGLPLGMSPASAYAVQQMALPRGNSLLLHTDGLLSLYGGMAFSAESLISLHAELRDAVSSGRSPLDPIREKAAATPDVRDDVTALCLTLNE